MLQTLIFGLSSGAMYALMALAIGIIYSTTRIFNFCHASIIMLGAMVAYYCIGVYDLPYIVGVLVAIGVNCVVNIVLYYTCLKGLGDLLSTSSWMITLFGAGLLLNNGARIIFGANENPFPYLFGGASFKIGSATILWHEIGMIVFAVVIGVAYQLLCQKTSFGRALRAVSFKPKTARLMGINSDGIIQICFLLAAAVAAIGGVLIAPTTFASFAMTTTIGLKGYAAAVIGGVGDTKGAFVGGFLLGLIECIVTMFIPAGLKDAFSFVLMIIIIIFLPGGVLSAKIFTHGNSATEKV